MGKEMSHPKVTHSIVLDLARLMNENQNPVGLQAEALLSAIMIYAEVDIAEKAFEILNDSRLELCRDTILDIAKYLDQKVSP